MAVEIKFERFEWQSGYGYIIEPLAELNWYYVVSYLDGGELASFSKISHQHYVNEPSVKSFPSEVSRKFIRAIFGESYRSPKVKFAI